MVILTASFENQCGYCIAAHSAGAAMQGVPQDLVDALRQGLPLKDARLEALHLLTRSLVQRQGWLSESEIGKFLSAGFTRAQVLEVILGVTFKTLSNYSNHIAHTPLDPPFRATTWTPPRQAAAAGSGS